MYRRPDVLLHIVMVLGLLCAACWSKSEVPGGGQREPTWFDLDGTWVNIVHSPQQRSLYGGSYCSVPLPNSGPNERRVSCFYPYLRPRYIGQASGTLIYDADGFRADCDLRSPLTAEADHRTVSAYGTLSLGYTGAGPVLAEDQTFRLSGEFIDTEYYMRCQLLSPRVMECVDRSDLDSGEATPDGGVYRFEKFDSLPNSITCERVLHDFISSGGVLE